eukprot:2037462-Karenia_brevis.AAC.1
MAKDVRKEPGKRAQNISGSSTSNLTQENLRNHGGRAANAARNCGRSSSKGSKTSKRDTSKSTNASQRSKGSKSS